MLETSTNATPCASSTRHPEGPEPTRPVPALLQPDPQPDQPLRPPPPSPSTTPPASPTPAPAPRGSRSTSAAPTSTGSSTLVDPLTGHSRIIIGDDQGVYTAVDNNGTFQTPASAPPPCPRGAAAATCRSPSSTTARRSREPRRAGRRGAVLRQRPGQRRRRSVGVERRLSYGQHRLGRPRRRRHRRGHRPDRQGHPLPVQLAVLRPRHRHRLLPGQRRRPDQRADSGQWHPAPSPTRSGRSSPASTSPSTRSRARRSS